MHDKIVANAVRWFGAVSLISGGLAACAGTDTPPVDDDLEDAIAQNYTTGGVAAAGRAGSGNAGSGSAGSGSAGSGNAGSANAPAAGSGGAPDDEDTPAAGGSAQEPDDEGPPPSSGGACNGFAVLEASCSGGSCHGANGLGNFAESEEAARSFVGVSGTISCSDDGPLLDPENPRASVIVQKVNGTSSCGGPMPIGGAQLSDEDIACLEDWIGSL